MRTWNVYCKKCKQAFVRKYEGTVINCPKCGAKIDLSKP